MSDPIIITGMHRSGTSLLASLLQSAGMFVGDRLLGPNDANPKGHFEDLDFVELHEEVLASNGTSLYLERLPVQMTVGETQRRRAADLVASRSTRPIWGWKDPRTTLFLDFWLGLAPGARFVFLFRSAAQVVDSLRRRRDPALVHHFRGAWVLRQLGFSTFKLKSAIGMWRHYNAEITRFAERHPSQSFVLHVQSLVKDPAVTLDRLGRRLGLGVQHADFSHVYDRDMLHSEVDPGVARACRRQRDVARIEERLSALELR